jgi:hypothetical protein
VAVTWYVAFNTTGWQVSIMTVIEVWVKRIVDGVVVDQHQIVDSRMTGLPPKTFVSVEHLSLSFTEFTLSKTWRVHYLDFNNQPQSFDYSISVPPFNGRTSTTIGWQDEETIVVPPIVIVPPPQPIPPPVPSPGVEPPPIIPPPIIVEPPPPCGDLDRQTFKEFWTMWGHQVDKIAFEVPLDEGVDVPDLPEPWRSVWRHLTHHRIDVVFSRKGSIYVAEIKPRLSIAAIGTAIVARTMFMRRYDVSKFEAVKAAVISQVGSPTLIQAAATHRVVVFLTKGIDGLYEPVALHDVIW